MLDEKDLLAIREMIQEARKQTVKEAMQGASVLMESYFEPKFNLLFENQQTMLETLAPKSWRKKSHFFAQSSGSTVVISRN